MLFIHYAVVLHCLSKHMDSSIYLRVGDCEASKSSLVTLQQADPGWKVSPDIGFLEHLHT